MTVSLSQCERDEIRTCRAVTTKYPPPPWRKRQLRPVASVLLYCAMRQNSLLTKTIGQPLMVMSEMTMHAGTVSAIAIKPRSHSPASFGSYD